MHAYDTGRPSSQLLALERIVKIKLKKKAVFRQVCDYLQSSSAILDLLKVNRSDPGIIYVEPFTAFLELLVV